MLAFFEAMDHPDELLAPVLKWKAHQVQGNRQGTWALNVTASWRLTFAVSAKNELCDLDLEDYH